MSDERPSLTAAELIEALKLIPGDTIVTRTESDYEYDSWYCWGVAGVDKDGELAPSNIVASGGLYDHVNEADDDNE